MIDLALLLVGLAGLVGGARLTVHQAIGISRRHGLSDVFVGTVVLAVGSDLPELVVSLAASVHNLRGGDTSGLIVGNAIGSCFGQIGLTMGIAGLMGYLTLARHIIFIHGGILLGSLLFLTLAALDGQITRSEGTILTAAFLVYLFMLLQDVKERETVHPSVEKHPAWLTWLLLGIGMTIVVVASELTVNAVIGLAATWGVEQSFIAILIIGTTTSLPELSISVAALMKARGGMSVGNLIGSNILDTLLPVGLAATIHPVAFRQELLQFDIPALFALTALVLLFFFRRKGLQKAEATALVSLYAIYLLVKILQA